MNKPTRSCMEAYLRQMGIMTLPANPLELEKEYYRQIYKVQSRETALTIPTTKTANRRHAQTRTNIAR
ncbi:hypothetical protein [Endozoicomonas ascidiicola]|uniref:hypothetical protein n=1 Tax=Endozoicomonas ascidiicola TaxID=1698521 RepID=UPI0008314F59|nr:hypothetical protein [Endozoicomonas ascidiicola]